MIDIGNDQIKSKYIYTKGKLRSKIDIAKAGLHSQGMKLLVTDIDILFLPIKK